ncbi:MAG: hypothetical protein KUG65_05990 [Sphingomonadaceae bacterium]|nr:hypothetical protein [Sphingomonadaceae bacterium]
MVARPFTSDLIAILGQEAFVRFCQEFGGTRVYVPYKMREDSGIVEAIGMEAAEKLSRLLAPAAIRVPLARRERALWFRGRGLSNARIARLLGMTETGIEKLFTREEDLPDKPGKCRNSAQLPLFKD